MKFQIFTTSFLFLISLSIGAQDKLLVAVQLPKDSAVIFDLQKKAIRGKVRVGFLPHEITYDSDSKNCFVSNFGLQDYDIRIGKPGNSIAVFNPWSCTYVKTIYTTPDTSKGNAPHGIKIRPGASKELYTNVEVGGDSMLIYNLATYSLKRAFPLPKSTHNFIFSNDGSRLWVMAAGAGIYEVNPADGKIIHHRPFPSPIRGLCLGKNWIVASGKNEIFLVSKEDLHIIKHISSLGVGQILYSGITPDQKYILSPAVEDNQVLVIEVRHGKVLKRLNTLKAPINVQVSANVAYVSHDEDNSIVTIDLKTYKTSQTLKAFGTNGFVLIK